MSILLESDSNAHYQSHFDELTARTTMIFIVVGFLTVVWSVFIDDILLALLTQLQPCSGPCLNLYDPAQWSAVRWLSSVLLAFCSAMPLMLYHLHQFAKPGLMSAEYKALKRITVFGSLTMVIGTFLLLTELLPALYETGHQQHQSVGLAAQYSAIDMLLVATYLVWTVGVFTTSWLLLTVAGVLGLVTPSNSDWWRVRVYGIGSLLLLITVPEHAQSLALPLIVFFMLSSESVGRRWYLTGSAVNGRTVDRFDEEGRRRRMTIVDCACEGANIHSGHAHIEGYSTIRVDGVCTRSEDRESILNHIIRTGCTDAVITGCDAKACPPSFVSNLDAIDASLHGLNLMDLANHRVAHNDPRWDTQLALLSISGPYPPHAFDGRLAELVSSHQRSAQDIKILSSSMNGWSNYIGSDMALVKRP